MNTQAIRPVALCVFRKDNQILVAEGYDTHKSERFFRPLGGIVNFGEYSWETIRREIKEELGEEITNLTFIGPAENLFQYQGTPGHEIIFMFEGEFVNKNTYKQEKILGIESDGQEFT
ncbi:MAG: NUDIX domain-containing protein, partial [Bacteroidetes bacterium]|nr:NUDIX domain-containing protein [Bacteroidota bacterium]